MCHVPLRFSTERARLYKELFRRFISAIESFLQTELLDADAIVAAEYLVRQTYRNFGI